METAKETSQKKEIIEIPIGKLRENPWIISTIVLGIVLILVIVFSNGVAISSKTVDAQTAGEKVLNFIESNPDLQGAVELVSTEKQGEIYEVVLNYQGQKVPVYATLDGEFLISGIVPLDQTAEIPSQQEAQPTQQAREQISEDDDPFIGDENAPVTIIEFSDYQCPYCSRFWAETLPQLKEEYIDTGKVKLIYRDYPLGQIHPMAQPAAEAAECVHELGGNEAYFEYHNKIFANQQSLSEANLKVWAKELGYDIEKCLDSGKYESEVHKDLADGGEIGTPTFYINGVKLEGAQPFSVFKQVIEAELEN